MNRGFTIIELVISIAIFVVMTSVVMSKYGTFNSSTLLTDTTYDLALVLHTAQTYGMSVKSVPNDSYTANFSSPYGVVFPTAPSIADGGEGGIACGTNGTADNKDIVLYADGDSNGVCDNTGSDVAINSYLIARGAVVSSMCVGNTSYACMYPTYTESNGGQVSKLSITFQRPNPEAKIRAENSTNQGYVKDWTYAEITIRGSDGSLRTLSIRQNGQISVKR